MEGPLRPPAEPGFRLIETMLWTPDKGVARRARHVARLRRSARRLGIEPEGISEALDAISGDGPLRVRLTVDAHGKPEVTTAAFTPLGPGTVWRLAVAETPLRADDPWLGVKTTERQLYDRTRASLPQGVDEMLFLNEAGEVCEGTITNVFVERDGMLLTPPLGCGVLPGILREALLEAGRAREARLSLSDLEDAQAIHVGNSLRGLIPARLV